MLSWLGSRAMMVMLICWPGQEGGSPTALTSPFVRVWSYLTTDTFRYRGAVTDGRNVYLPLAGGQLLALNLISGERVWAANYEADLATELQVDDWTLYGALAFPTDDTDKSRGTLLAVDKQTGQALWRKSFDEPITSLTQHWPAGQPDTSRLYVGTATGAVIALDTSSRRPVWEFRSRGAIRSHVRQDEGVVYVGSDDGHLYALDAATGAERWRFETRGPVRARVEVESTWVFVASFDGSVYCLDKRTGKRRWRMRTGAAIESQPTRVNDTLIVSSYDNFVYGLDPHSKALRWKVRLSGRIIADPIARDNAVLLSVLRGHRVVVLRAEDGKEIQSLELGEGFEIVAPPVMAGDILVLTTDQGVIAARLVSTGGSSHQADSSLTGSCNKCSLRRHRSNLPTMRETTP